MKPYAEQFYKSKQWQDCRNSYMKKVGGLCELCMKEGKITPAEEVHHKVHLNPQNINDPTVALNYDNLIALCREHHRQEHGARKRRYKIDEWGRVTPI